MSGSISTIEDILPRLQEIANGEKTVFSADFDFISSDFVMVYLGKEKQTTGFTVDQTSNTVTFTTAPTSGTVVTIVRAIPVDWESETAKSALDRDALNRIYSLLVGKMQTIKEEVSRCMKTPIYSSKNGEQLSQFFLEQITHALDVLDNAEQVIDELEEKTADSVSQINSATQSGLAQMQEKIDTVSAIADEVSGAAAQVDAAVEEGLEDIETALGYALSQLNLGLYYTKEEANGTFMALSGNQTASGEKTFTGQIRVKSSGIDDTSAPDSNIYDDNYVVLDKNSSMVAYGGAQQTTGNNIINRMGVKRIIDGVAKYASIEVHMDSTGKPSGQSPHPSDNTTSTASTQIMTVGAMNDASKNFNIVHRSGNETVGGTKTFTSEVRRTGAFSGLTTWIVSGIDSNGKGTIANSAYYTGTRIYNRQSAFNSTSDKTGYLDAICDDDGNFWAQVGGNGTYRKADSASTANMQVLTASEVNDPSLALNLVHRTGDEEITGSKTFTSIIYKKNSFPVSSTISQAASSLDTLDSNGVPMSRFESGTGSNYNFVRINVRNKNNTTWARAVELQLYDSGQSRFVFPTPTNAAENSTQGATTAWVNSRITSIMNSKQLPELTQLFLNTSGLNTGNIQLSQPFTNFKKIIVGVTFQDFSSLALLEYDCAILNWILEGNPINKHFTFPMAGQYWNIKNYSNGSSTTLLKTDYENCRFVFVYGVTY